MYSLRTLLKQVLQSPGKSIMILISVSLGVCIFILTLAIGSHFRETLRSQLVQEGRVITVQNATVNASGQWEPVDPPQIDARAPEIIGQGMNAVVSPVSTFVPIVGFSYREEDWLFRSLLGVNEDYAEVMSLNIIAGAFFSREDLENDSPVMAISRSFAETVFGTADAAIGEIVLTEVFSLRVVAVYEDPPALQRRIYSIPDAVLPIGAAVSGFTEDKEFRKEIEDYLNSTFQVRVRDLPVEQAKSQIQALLTAEYGSDFEVISWVGSIHSPDDILEQMSSSVNNFATSIGVFGFVLLFAASIGILSIMLVETLANLRQIALERAMGASKRQIIIEFFQKSVILSLVGALIGIGSALIFAIPLGQFLSPLYGIFEIELSTNLPIGIVSILSGLGTALLVGGVLGVIPVIPLFKTTIAESIREA